MRTLCLNLQQAQELSCAEIFLRFSPRVQFRYPHYVFIDIESTAGLFGGEFQVLKQAVDLARSFAPHATGAIASTPYFAQLLVNYHPYEITDEGKDFEVCANAPVEMLVDFEGLSAWAKVRQVQSIIHSFKQLGFTDFEDLMALKVSALRERWGDLGVTLWKRLHSQEAQVISPLESVIPLTGYGHFDDPVLLVPVLWQKLGPQMDFLFMRLAGLGRFAKKLELILHCEYSNKVQTIDVLPASPNRDLQLFKDLLDRKLENMDLENPVREFEINILDTPEKVLQYDFFEPRDTTEDRWRRLISFAQQGQCSMGFLQMEAEHFPEQSYQLVTDWPRELSLQDLVEFSEKAIQVKTSHGKNLNRGPRPSLLLKTAKQLSKQELSAMKLFNKIPAERIESGWWFNKNQSRDYYFALSHQGQLLWIYQDRNSKEYYLHGYFD